ncbi:hypothetical protein BKA61DRAFT_219061 [Leptodontidium sp. MPI-SDFR-AT-0119]|nr:hypothetical protein BKA61DRAFT_219061 [Leptodontidium sp. MPI-SDFR-AT-0119]
MSTFKVIIIGGGLSGCLLGNGLLQNGIGFTLYESDLEDAKREGYQIRLGAPALEGFKECMTDKQLGELYPLFGRSGGIVSSAPITYDIHMNPLLDLTKFPAYTKSSPINRILLLNFLAKPVAAAGRLKYGKRFTHYTTFLRPSGTKTRAFFDDGTSDECDLLISAEGSRSKINRQIGLNNIVQLRGCWNFLAKGNLPPSKLLSLSPEIRKAPVGAFKDGMMLFISAYLPDGYNKVSSKKDASGLEYDAEIASIFWSLSVPIEMVPGGDAKNIESKLEFCIDRIKNWDPRFRDMLRTISDDSITAFQPRTSTEPPRGWRQKIKNPDNLNLGNDHVWMIGDAYHAMLPGRGMGGNQAMRDNVDALPLIVDLARKSKEGTLLEQDYAVAVKTFEKKMTPRAFSWVRASGGSGELVPPNLDGVRGWLIVFAISRALDLAYLYGVALRFFGYGPKDDAPELPD